MHDTAKVPGTRDDGRPAPRPMVDEELADQLLGKAQAEGVELPGPDGLLSQVTKAVLERALAEEMTGHLGYEKHDPAGRGSGNSRNGTTPKTVLTEVGAVDLAVPRDRGGTFEPQIVRKGQTRLKGFNERIIALYARGMTTRDIRAHLREMYDVEVSPDLISRVTDAVIDELAGWQSRPLDRVWPVIFTRALMVKIRDEVVANRPVYLAIGIDCDGAKQVLGLWAGPTTGESAKFWMSVLSELRSRGVADVCIVLRRADRAARRDRRGLAPGDRPAVRRALRRPPDYADQDGGAAGGGRVSGGKVGIIRRR
jgi:transposase-like protein